MNEFNSLWLKKAHATNSIWDENKEKNDYFETDENRDREREIVTEFNFPQFFYNKFVLSLAKIGLV